MPTDDFTADRELNVAQLGVDSHAIYGREWSDAMTRVLMMRLRQEFLAIRRRWAKVARSLGRVVLNSVVHWRAKFVIEDYAINMLSEKHFYESWLHI